IHISCRYEFHNKGIDVFLEALKNVNDTLKGKSDHRDIIAFIWVPAPVSGIKSEILEAFKVAKKHREIIQAPLMRIEEWLSQNLVEYKKHLETKELNEFFTKNEINQINKLAKQNASVETKQANPPICPFNLNEKDTIYQTLLQIGLMNNSDDCVKVIFYPVYLSKNDQLLSLNYYDAVAGCDMGIYPSTYEPYGLTPLEALALGVPAVTTDLSGFGLLVTEQTTDDACGIHVLKRKGRTNSEAARDLAEVIIKHSKLTKENVQKARETAREISELYSWRNIIKEYKNAYDQALNKMRNTSK
ncbi:MAG: glycosyltransferase, partial [Candidatus Heimdallarchaeota archaeon]